jgi:glycerophosphoryl diester phosphodiesterase
MKKEFSWIKEIKISHRGLHKIKDGIIENSIEAFERSIKYNYTIELDIHILADGEIVVYHDYNLERLTGTNKIIENINYNELQKIKFKNINSKIPLLKDVLELVNGKVPLLIEVKKRVNDYKLEETLLKLLNGYNGLYALQSFNYNSVEWMMKNFPNIATGQLVGDYKESKNYVKFIVNKLILNDINKPDFVACNIKHIPNYIIKYVKNNNLYLLAWTARNKNQYKNALKICDNVIFEKFLIE